MGIYIKGDFKNPYPNCDECIFGESIRCEAMTRREVYDYDVDCPLSEIEISDKAECDNCIWNVCNYNKIDWDVSEDCISREYMLEKAQEWKNMYSDNVFASVFARDALTMLKIEIENAPSVVPSIAEGKWIEHKYAEEYDGLMQSNFECSKCHDWLRKQSNYCPNCGAKIKGAEE